MSYPVGRLAELAGVTVRTLHHYDRIGLLPPSDRSHAGYRHYDSRDLERLRQILITANLASDSTRSPSWSTNPASTQTHICATSTGYCARASTD